MTLFAAATKIAGPHIDWAALSPLMALAAGGIVVLLVGLFRPAVIRARRHVVAGAATTERRRAG